MTLRKLDDEEVTDVERLPLKVLRAGGGAWDTRGIDHDFYGRSGEMEGSLLSAPRQ